jgi:hypothetical protein
LKSQNFYKAARQFLASARLLLQLKRYAMIMVVMTPREKWTDERLDDLNKKVDKGFEETKAEMRQGFAHVDGEIKGLGSETKAEITDLRREMKGGFEGLYRLLFNGGVVIIAALIGIIATLIGVNAF